LDDRLFFRGEEHEKGGDMTRKVIDIEGLALRELGMILRMERERQGLTQREVGKKIGKSKIAIHFYETGQRPVNLGRLIELCLALRVSPRYVMERWMGLGAFNILDKQWGKKSGRRQNRQLKLFSL
jgi:transcriptional regulator with XRE-family HTH domain